MNYGDLHINQPKDPALYNKKAPAYLTMDEIREAATIARQRRQRWKIGGGREDLAKDNLFSDHDRDKAFQREISQRNDFVHRSSYNKAIGYINRRDQVHLFNGSSYNRKETPKKTPLTEDQKYERELLDAYHDFKNCKGSGGLVKHDRNYEKIKERQQLIEERKGKHTLSKRSKDKIKDKMLAFYRACAGRNGFRSHVVDFTFVTLTFIAPVDDNKGMDLLNNFFVTLKKRYGKFNYMQVCERQGNGNIHFHIVADMRFPIGYINSLWVKQQTAAGVRNWDAEQLLYNEHGTTFESLHTAGAYAVVQDYLNPVDVKKIKTIDGVSCYLTNYVTKNEGSFDCAVWSSSEAVSRIFTCAMISEKQFVATGDPNKNKITSKGKEIESNGVKHYKPPRTYVNATYYGEYCTINTIYNKSRFRHYLNEMEEINKMILGLSNNDIKPAREEIIECIAVDPVTYRKQTSRNLRQLFNGSAFEFSDPLLDLNN